MSISRQSLLPGLHLLGLAELAELLRGRARRHAVSLSTCGIALNSPACHAHHSEVSDLGKKFF